MIMLKLLVKGSKSLKVNDTPWYQVIVNLNYLEKSYVKVGFPETGKLGNKNKKGSGHEPVDTMSEIIMVASLNEFGTKKIPERPFMRQSFDNNIKELNELKEKIYKKVIWGQLTAREALNLLGIWMVARTKREIKNGNFEELSDFTIEKKGSNKPLIDIAQMINSIQYQVVFIKPN